MKRYFFHIYNGSKLVTDDVGTLLKSHIEVRLHMLALAQIWMGLERSRDVIWRLEVWDDNRNVVGSVRFGLDNESPGLGEISD